MYVIPRLPCGWLQQLLPVQVRVTPLMNGNNMISYPATYIYGARSSDPAWNTVPYTWRNKLDNSKRALLGCQQQQRSLSVEPEVRHRRDKLLYIYDCLPDDKREVIYFSDAPTTSDTCFHDLFLLVVLVLVLGGGDVFLSLGWACSAVSFFLADVPPVRIIIGSHSDVVLPRRVHCGQICLQLLLQSATGCSSSTKSKSLTLLVLVVRSSRTFKFKKILHPQPASQVVVVRYDARYLYCTSTSSSILNYKVCGSDIYFFVTASNQLFLISPFLSIRSRLFNIHIIRSAYLYDVWLFLTTISSVGIRRIRGYRIHTRTSTINNTSTRRASTIRY